MADIVQKSWDERQWMPTETAGLEYSGLRAHASGGATFFLRFASGTQARPHNHPEGEELYVVSGDVTIGGRRLRTGDYLYTPPNEVHDAVAHAESVLLLHAPKLPVFL
jgi:quercetin dioxygenase-like cupin family protein